MSLRYLLDTNICIYIAKQHPISVLEKFEKLTIGEVGMSTITYGELLHGAQKSQFKKKNNPDPKRISNLNYTTAYSNKRSRILRYYKKLLRKQR